MKIGIDIGNVIIGGEGQDTSFFTDNYLSTPEVPGAIDSIVALKEAGHEISLISKCGDEVRNKSLWWLDYKEFWSKTGLVDCEDVYFVYHRMDKFPVARALRLDVFIDDRQDIIDDMYPIIEAILFRSWEKTNERLAHLGAFTEG